MRLEGPESRSLLTDGSGWFGAVDLLPGSYVLTVEVPSPATALDLPLNVTAGVVTEQVVRLPSCAAAIVHVPVVWK